MFLSVGIRYFVVPEFFLDLKSGIFLNRANIKPIIRPLNILCCSKVLLAIVALLLENV